MLFHDFSLKDEFFFSKWGLYVRGVYIRDPRVRVGYKKCNWAAALFRKFLINKIIVDFVCFRPFWTPLPCSWERIFCHVAEGGFEWISKKSGGEPGSLTPRDSTVTTAWGGAQLSEALLLLMQMEPPCMRIWWIRKFPKTAKPPTIRAAPLSSSPR